MIIRYEPTQDVKDETSAKLAADYARHLELKVELERIMAFTAKLAAKRRIQAAIRPLPVAVGRVA